VRKLERQLSRLEGQLNGYQVVDLYDDLVSEANGLQRSIDDLTNANVLDDELARDIAAAMLSDQAPALPDLVQLYQQASVVLSSDTRCPSLPASAEKALSSLQATSSAGTT
jgi:hypothetical protein